MGSLEQRSDQAPIAYAIGLPGGANVQREGVGSLEQRSGQVPIAYAIGLPGGANVQLRYSLNSSSTTCVR